MAHDILHLLYNSCKIKRCSSGTSKSTAKSTFFKVRHPSAMSQQSRLLSATPRLDRWHWAIYFQVLGWMYKYHVSRRVSRVEVYKLKEESCFLPRQRHQSRSVPQSSINRFLLSNVQVLTDAWLMLHAGIYLQRDQIEKCSLYRQKIVAIKLIKFPSNFKLSAVSIAETGREQQASRDG